MEKEKITFIIIVIVLIIWAFGVSFMMANFSIKSLECAEDFGGRVTRGYCIYVENGTSKSFSIWEGLNETEEVQNR